MGATSQRAQARELPGVKGSIHKQKIWQALLSSRFKIQTLIAEKKSNKRKPCINYFLFNYLIQELLTLVHYKIQSDKREIAIGSKS